MFLSPSVAVLVATHRRHSSSPLFVVVSSSSLPSVVKRCCRRLIPGVSSSSSAPEHARLIRPSLNLGRFWRGSCAREWRSLRDIGGSALTASMVHVSLPAGVQVRQHRCVNRTHVLNRGRSLEEAASRVRAAQQCRPLFRAWCAASRGRVRIRLREVLWQLAWETCRETLGRRRGARLLYRERATEVPRTRHRLLERTPNAGPKWLRGMPDASSAQGILTTNSCLFRPNMRWLYGRRSICHLVV